MKLFNLDRNVTVKEIVKKYGVQFVCLTLIVLICLIHAISTIYTVNFFPINGTFQNFNVVRRLIDGQAPYTDFSVYLGMGHLYIGGLFTLIFGGDFSASIMAFSFLTILTPWLFSIIIGKVINGKKSKVPYIVTLITLVMLMTQPLIFRNGLGTFERLRDSLNLSLNSGNSARFIRGMALIFIIVFSNFMFWVMKKISAKVNIKPKSKQYIKLMALSIGAGLTFLWGNDYGIACWICSIIMIFFITFAFTKSIKKTLVAGILHITVSIITIILLMFIVTKGNINSWLFSLFGTGGAQTWYYGLHQSEKNYYLYDIDVSFITISIALLCIYYLIKLYKNITSKELWKTYAILAYMTMVSFAAVNEYRLLSSGELVEVAYVILFFIIIYEITKKLSEIIIHKKMELCKFVRNITILCGVAVLITNTKDCILSFELGDRGVYVEELGGYLTELNEDIDLAKKFIGNEKVFSTYASALETVTNQYQPSGADYIIHVLGDKNREKYLNSFNEQNFKYVATINENYTEYEYWIKNANWFFYRELYKKYVPVFSNSYQIFWEKKEDDVRVYNGNINTEIIVNHEKNVTIKVKTDENVNGIADVKIKYDTKKDGSLSSKLILNKMVLASNLKEVSLHEGYTYSNWFMKESGEEYIPITIINGEGEVSITSIPERDTILNVENAECEIIYTTYFEYLPITTKAYRNNDKVTVCVSNSSKNLCILDNANSIDIGDTNIKIINMENSNKGINITLDYEDVDKFNEYLQRNNVCRINFD